MKTLRTTSVMTLSVIALILGLTGPLTTFAATTPDLGTATSFGILTETFTNTVAGTVINGDIGYTTGPVVVPTVNGTTHSSADATYVAAGSGQAAALIALNTPTCDFTFGAGVTDLGADTTHNPSLPPGVYEPGVYCTIGAVSVAPLTFSGAGTYIFRIPGTFDTVTTTNITLTHGASACDVFWTPTGATVLGATTNFIGTIIGSPAITVGDTTTWTGRALAFGASKSVTISNGNVNIIVPTCTPPPATLHIIKQVVNTGGGIAIPSDFTLSVKNSSGSVVGGPTAGTGTPGTSYTLTGAIYTVSEIANASYVQSFGGACSSTGSVILSSGDDKTCTVINTYIIPPPVSSGGGGGNLRVDVCPEGDYSYSYYDGICGTAPIVADRIVPLIGIIKVPTPLALPAGSGSVTYNYVVWNVGGKQALTSVSIADDKCSTVKLLSGDINNNQKLDPTEKWKYSCTSTLLATTTNTAVASGYGDDTYRQIAVATAVATVVVGAPLTPPLISIVKVPSRLTPFSFGGGDVTYTYTVRNPGIVAMHDVVVTDDKCAPVAGPVGDTNRNNLFETTEKWVYTCRTNVPVSTMNTATAKGQANGFTAISHAFANVLVSPAVIAKITPRLPNTGLPQKEASIPWNMVALASILMLASASLLIAFRKRNI